MVERAQQWPLPLPEIGDEDGPPYCILRTYPGAEGGTVVQLQILSKNEVGLVSPQPFTVGTRLIGDFYDKHDRPLCSRKLRITKVSYQPGVSFFVQADVDPVA
jgi:hypothetical protein